MARLETREHPRRPTGGEQRARTHDAQARGAGASVTHPLLRLVTAGLVIATGAIHFYLYLSYFSAVPTIGRLFLANSVTAVLLGALIIGWRTPWSSMLGALFCLTTLGAFFISVEWGLFGYQEALQGTWQTRAAVVEAVGTLAGIGSATTSWRQSRHPDP